MLLRVDIAPLVDARAQLLRYSPTLKMNSILNLEDLIADDSQKEPTPIVVCVFMVQNFTFSTKSFLLTDANVNLISESM